MGGKILEFSADKYFYAGFAVGYQRGYQHGYQRGEQKVIQLVNALIANGRRDEIAHVMDDEVYRAALYKQYAIV